MAAAAEAAAAGEVEAACARAGWTLLQGLCCLGPGWVSRHWGALCTLLHCELAWQLEECRAATAGTTDAGGGGGGGSASSGSGDGGSHTGVVDAWRWTITASACGTLLAVVRVLADSVHRFDAVARSLASLLDCSLAVLNHAAGARAGATLTAAATCSATADVEGVAAARLASGVITLDDGVAPAGFVTVGAAAAYVARRAVVHTAACVLEAASCLPLATTAFARVHGGLLNAALAALTGGVVGVAAPALEALADGRVASGGGNVGVVTAPAASVLVAALTESGVPEVSADLLCLFRCDSVLTRGLGEGADPMLGATAQGFLSAHVRSRGGVCVPCAGCWPLGGGRSWRWPRLPLPPSALPRSCAMKCFPPNRAVGREGPQ